MSMELNAEQRAAVGALSGPVIIAAGAGSGKTRTLCERFVHAASDTEDRGVWRAADVDRILAITFTDKAAGEIAERVRATLRSRGRNADAQAVDGAWISTIHGLCSRILRRTALEAGVDPGFAIADPVLAERLKEEAFELAAREELATVEGAALFDSFGFSAVYRAVTAAGAHPVALSRGVDVITQPEGGRPVRELLAEAIALFEPAAGEVAACGSTTKTAAKLEDCCTSALAALRDIDPRTLTEGEAARRLVEALGEWVPQRALKGLEDVQPRIDAKHAELCLESFAALDAEYGRSLARLAKRYRELHQALKREHGVLDFDDLQTTVASLLERDPEVRARCRAQFRLTMVDEFQDTDALQLSVIGRLAGDDLCSVGDERQAIYGFRGADLAVYRAHIDEMRAAGARAFSLDTNYRSNPRVLATVNALFGHPALFGSRFAPLQAGRRDEEEARDGGGIARVALAVGDTSGCGRGESRRREAAWVAERFAELSSRHTPGEMVVLIRSYTHAEVYASALREVGLDAAVVGGSRLFERTEIRMARALIRVIGNPHDEAALVELLAGDAVRVTDDGLHRLAVARAGERQRAALWEAMRDAPPGLGDIDVVRVSRAVHAIEEARADLGRRPLAELMLRAFERLDVDLLLLARGAEGRQSFANVLQLVRRIAAIEEQGMVGPAAVESHLAALEAYGAKATPAALVTEGSDVVRIMSVHASKGLEFPVVAAVELDGYLGGGGSSAIALGPEGEGSSLGFATKPPEIKGLDPAGTRYGRMVAAAALDEAGEAQRLFYVACTRAEEVLLLAGSAKLSKPADPADAEPMAALRRIAPGIDQVDPVAGAVTLDVDGAQLQVEVLEGEGVSGDHAPDVVDPAPPLADPGRERTEPPGARQPHVRSGGTPHALPARVSYSDFAAYDRCGLRFAAQRVVRLGAANAPSPGTSADFGSAVHAALQLATQGECPPPERLDAIARWFGLDTDARAVMEATIRAFLGSSAAARLEGHESVRREWSFAVRLGEGDGAFDLAGSLDAYGRTGGEALVIDYKTGVSGDEASLRERYALQAACYAVAVAADGCERARIEFVRPQVIDQDGRPQSVIFDFGPDEIAAARSDLLGRHERMRTSGFRPLARWDHVTCSTCPIARTLCTVRPSGSSPT